MEVLSDAMEEVGVCMERMRERVERNLRRIRCGRRMWTEGHEKGSLETEKKRWVESSPPREKYWVSMAGAGVDGGVWCVVCAREDESSGGCLKAVGSPASPGEEVAGGTSRLTGQERRAAEACGGRRVAREVAGERGKMEVVRKW